jgi:hypothetical protein
MPPLINAARPQKAKWVYASLSVRDGDRLLNPCQVAPDWLLFAQPPHLASPQVEIILTNGPEEQRGYAQVLPHDPNATKIPIRLLAAD